MPRRTSTAAKAAAHRPSVTIKPHEPFFAKPPVVAGVLAVMAVSAVYLWISQPEPTAPYLIQTTWTSKNSQNIKQGSEHAVKRVSELMVVPAGKPSVYTVTDSQAFQSQSGLLGEVELGDKVLVWPTLVVVYSPLRDRISGVMPGSSLTFAGKTLDSEAPPVTNAGSTEPEEGSTIEIRNGSGVNGAASRLRTSLTSQGLTVSRIGDAGTRPTGTVIVDLSGGKVPNALSRVVNLTDGTVSELPPGEPTSNASVLIIIGS